MKVNKTLGTRSQSCSLGANLLNVYTHFKKQVHQAEEQFFLSVQQSNAERPAAAIGRHMVSTLTPTICCQSYLLAIEQLHRSSWGSSV